MQFTNVNCAHEHTVKRNEKYQFIYQSSLNYSLELKIDF